jgi:hypothetical protein
MAMPRTLPRAHTSPMPKFAKTNDNLRKGTCKLLQQRY